MSNRKNTGTEFVPLGNAGCEKTPKDVKTPSLLLERMESLSQMSTELMTLTRHKLSPITIENNEKHPHPVEPSDERGEYPPLWDSMDSLLDNIEMALREIRRSLNTADI